MPRVGPSRLVQIHATSVYTFRVGLLLYSMLLEKPEGRMRCDLALPILPAVSDGLNSKSTTQVPAEPNHISIIRTRHDIDT